MTTILFMVLFTVGVAAAVAGEVAYRKKSRAALPWPFRSRGDEFGKIVDEDLAERRERLKSRMPR